ncbi:hypothetical protein ABK040_012716 [Willaertia magna]
MVADQPFNNNYIPVFTKCTAYDCKCEFYPFDGNPSVDNPPLCTCGHSRPFHNCIYVNTKCAYGCENPKTVVEGMLNKGKENSLRTLDIILGKRVGDEERDNSLTDGATPQKKPNLNGNEDQEDLYNGNSNVISIPRNIQTVDVTSQYFSIRLKMEMESKYLHPVSPWTYCPPQFKEDERIMNLSFFQRFMIEQYISKNNFYWEDLFTETNTLRFNSIIGKNINRDMPTIRIEEDLLVEIPDVIRPRPSGNGEFNFTDGCGEISFDLAKEITEKYYPELSYMQLHRFRKAQFKFLLEKSQVELPESRTVFGVCDRYNVLKPGQVCIRKVLVGKNPCVHPGDIRILEAVRRDELLYIHNAIVFSTQGDRPDFHKISGSDLDGDENWAIQLAEKCSEAVDSAKTGIVVQIPTFEKFDLPHYMKDEDCCSNRTYYISTTLIGQIYDAVKEYMDEIDKLVHEGLKTMVSIDKTLLLDSRLKYIDTVSEDFENYSNEVKLIEEKLKGQYAAELKNSEYKKLNDKYRCKFLEISDLTYETQLSIEQRLAKASACYDVCYNNAINKRQLVEKASLSYPWSVCLYKFLNG